MIKTNKNNDSKTEIAFKKLLNKFIGIILKLRKIVNY